MPLQPGIFKTLPTSKLTEAVQQINRARQTEFLPAKGARLFQALLATGRVLDTIASGRPLSRNSEIDMAPLKIPQAAGLLVQIISEESSLEIASLPALDDLAAVDFPQGRMNPEPFRKVWKQWGAEPGNPHHAKTLAQELLQLVLEAGVQMLASEGALKNSSSASTAPEEWITVSIPIMQEILEHLLDRPSHYLATYGSLAPGETHAHRLDGLDGHWREGRVQGLMENTQKLYFIWNALSGWLPVHLFHSSRLGELFPDLDPLVGPEYSRTLVPVRTEEGLQTANIYSKKDPTP